MFAEKSYLKSGNQIWEGGENRGSYRRQGS
jgi:hypothetical protein